MAKNKKKRPVSKRQQQVIALIIKEDTYADIAGELGIKYSTVVTHVERIKLRYLCHTEQGIVAFALNDGFTFSTVTRHVFYMGKVVF